jgi:hypothetical protein
VSLTNQPFGFSFGSHLKVSHQRCPGQQSIIERVHKQEKKRETHNRRKRSSRAQERANERERLGYKRERKMGEYHDIEPFHHLGHSVVAVRERRVVGWIFHVTVKVIWLML